MDAEPVVAAAVAEPEPPNPVHEVLTICGITNNAANRETFITIEGLDSVEAFASMNSDSNVLQRAKQMASRLTATGRVILGTMQIKRFQALVYWVKDHDKRGLQAQPEMWTREVMLAAMARKESDHNLDKVDIDIIEPGKCQTDAGWDNWQIGFVNKLSTIMGAAKVPIDYIECYEWDYTDELFLNDDEMRCFQMPLEGQNFKNWYSRY